MKKKFLKIIVAISFTPYVAVSIFKKNTDEIIYLIASKYFRGVGGFYEDFNQVEDAEVIMLLRFENPIE